jgi:hypothetical protein
VSRLVAVIANAWVYDYGSEEDDASLSVAMDLHRAREVEVYDDDGRWVCTLDREDVGVW